ncbi:hypothetical protein KEJ18_02375 [Candidatus Bathyarchaeota archaeon]|nr:hypothetical protein [Candidatus Bathyarchaeota archaeon]
MPIKYRKDEVYKLPNNDRERLKIYDKIIFNALTNRDENNQVVTAKIRIILTSTNIMIYPSKEYFID